jgi:hypothetical protein
MKSFILEITCPYCGGMVHEVNVGSPVDGGTAVNAVVGCTRCKRDWGVHVQMIRVGVIDDDGAVHGNSTAVKLHRNQGQPLCESCRQYEWRRTEERTAARAPRTPQFTRV